jgi:cyclic pyranopterin phosphate synthase
VSAHGIRMIDVGDKDVTLREAVASGAVVLGEKAFAAVVAGECPKGDVLTAARLAGIQAAKRTWEIIPLCHPLSLDFAEVDLEPRDGRIEIVARVRARARTGVEMEAFAAVSGAALTVYDMTKGIDRSGEITDIRLEEKRGGKSGDYVRGER